MHFNYSPQCFASESTDNRVNLKVNRLGCCCFHFSQVNVTAVIKPKIPSSPHCCYVRFEIIGTSYFSANKSDKMFLRNFLMRLYILDPFHVKIKLLFYPSQTTVHCPPHMLSHCTQYIRSIETTFFFCTAIVFSNIFSWALLTVL